MRDIRESSIMKFTLGLLVVFVVSSPFVYKYDKTRYALSKIDITTKESGKKEALLELSELAKDGVAEAQGRLAQEYYDGILIKGNDEKAFYWAEKGYLAKDPLSTILLAKMYYEGSGVEKDASKAVSLMEEVKDKRQDAKYILGRMYLNGIGEENSSDFDEGLDLIKQAADSGMALAQNDYAKFMYMDASSLDLSQEGNIKVKEKIESKVAEYLAMASAQNYAESTEYLAICFNNGIGVKVDKIKAKELMTLASEQGSVSAKNRLAQNNYDWK